MMQRFFASFSYFYAKQGDGKRLFVNKAEKFRSKLKIFPQKFW